MNKQQWSQYVAAQPIFKEGAPSEDYRMRSGMGTKSIDQPILDQSSNNFKVVIRVRPPLSREVPPNVPFQSSLQISGDHKVCTAIEYLGAETEELERQRDIRDNPHICQFHSFKFDYVYDEQSSQSSVYEHTAKPAVMSALEGYNATVLAYGQTGTGKTYTMEGFQFSGQHPDRGIVPRAMEEIFKYIEHCPNGKTAFMVRASYLQIYNEVISDLLKGDRSNLLIREDKRKGVFVEGLSEWAVRSPYEIYNLMKKGTHSRITASTKLNDLSSRSHAVFIIIVEQMNTIEDEPRHVREVEGDDVPKQIKVGKLNLVDLAGSERLSITGATGKRLEECKKINQSLSALGNVIAALTDPKSRTHIPYRDSKLTRLLEDSLGGNCKTTMMAMVSPCYSCFSESLSSLKFANRAKNIKNNAKINEDVDQRALLRKYEIELRTLRKELEEKNKNVMNKEVLYKLEEDKRRAEEDKAAAITALESRSREYMKEKEEKRKLEDKIRMMSSQMLLGGKKIEDTPQFRSALEEKQKLIRKEYESKMQELEKERQQIEEDKAQVDRYKQLLLKQRDIMIALTARLNERDETIIQLQEELDAYDRIHKETEDKLERKNERMKLLEGNLATNGLEVPQDDVEEDEGQNKVEGLRRKYPPYATEAAEDAPLYLLTAEEKISELMEVIEKQKEAMEGKGCAPSGSESMGVDRAKENDEELREKDQIVQEQEKMIAGAKAQIADIKQENIILADEKAKLVHVLENNILPLAENAISGIKEQKDQYRLYHISQDIQSLQKCIVGTITNLKNNSKLPQVVKMDEGKSTKLPMSVLNLNGQSQKEDSTLKNSKRLPPPITQEDNIRRALREYYAKK